MKIWCDGALVEAEQAAAPALAHGLHYGTGAEVTSVAELGDRRWNPGPVTRELQAAYQDLVHGRSGKHRHWLTWLPTEQDLASSA